MNFQSLGKRGTTLFVVVFALFWLLKPGAPIEQFWLDATASLAGVDPFVPPDHPLWCAAVWALTKLPLSWAKTVPLLGCLSGAACVVLLYRFLLCLNYRHARDAAVNEKARKMAAAVAAVIALFCSTMPLAAAAMAPHTLGLAILLGSFVVSAKWREGDGLRRLYVSALLSGLAVGEYPMLAAGVFIHGLVWLVRMLRIVVREEASQRTKSLKQHTTIAHKLRASAVRNFAGALLDQKLAGPAIATTCLLAGVAPFFLRSWAYSQSEVAGWLGMEVPLLVMRSVLVNSVREGFAVVPAYGWGIPLILLSVLPLFWMVLQRAERPPVFSQKETRSQKDKNRDVNQWAGFLVRTGLYAITFGIVVVIQLTPNAWSAFSGLPPTTGIVLQLIAAAWIGRWAGSLLVISRQKVTRDASETATTSRAGWPLFVVCGVVLLALAAPIIRWGQAKVPEARWRWAREIAAQMNGRTWLVSDGSINTLAYAAASDAGAGLNVMDLSQERHGIYCKALARKFPEPRKRALCESGPLLVLAEWLAARDGTAESTLAFLSNGMAWQGSGREFVPAGVLYLGASTSAPPDTDSVWKSNEHVWKTLRPPPGSPMALHASKLANDCGVWFGRRGDTKRAVISFKQALAFNTNNISVRLNLASAGGLTVEEITPAITAVMATSNTAARLHALRALDGFVLDPARWSSNGWLWAWSGSAGVPPTNIAEIAQKQQWKNADVLAARGKIMAERGGQAAESMKQAQSLMRNADYVAARALAEQSYRESPTFAALKIMLALDLHAEKLDRVAPEARQVLLLKPGDAFANFALGYLCYASNRLDEAATFYRASIEAESTAHAWGEISRVLWLQNRIDEAGTAAEKAVSMEPRQALGWRIRGLVLAKRGEKLSAKEALKKAVACDPNDSENQDALASLDGQS